VGVGVFICIRWLSFPFSESAVDHTDQARDLSERKRNRERGACKKYPAILSIPLSVKAGTYIPYQKQREKTG